jgi:hypothetical protein
MDWLDSYKYTICNKIWKAEGQPQLSFCLPSDVVTGRDKYVDEVMVGNTKPEILIPYRILGPMLFIKESVFTISYIKEAHDCKCLSEMELIDENGNAIVYRELMYAESPVPYSEVKVPF